MQPRFVLVTGADKGIGHALCAEILASYQDTRVVLCTRDATSRGKPAKAALGRANRERVYVVEMDVTDDASVRAAAISLRTLLAGRKLHAIVSNAGVFEAGSMTHVLNTNARGAKRVCDAFVPLLDERVGRVVFVSSSAGPAFVSTCSPERRRVLVDPAVSWAQLDAIISEVAEIEQRARGAPPGADFRAVGLGDGASLETLAYGLSKACVNAYMQILARSHPRLLVSACTPGFLETDLTKPYLERTVGAKTAAELGMQPAREGTKVTMHLLFSTELAGSGCFYGADAKRAPLHRYRSSGDPPFAGEWNAARGEWSDPASVP